ncbi:hypothetical protein ONA70_35870, partial [Micromonospora yasonensis]|uniref:hypothetical protein n=1 Tax=Micromonospora yasonensis TaxID=1128667 RepID=UPI0022310E96
RTGSATRRPVLHVSEVTASPADICTVTAAPPAPRFGVRRDHPDGELRIATTPARRAAIRRRRPITPPPEPPT